MYAETLRLYTSLFALCSASHGDFDFRNYAIPKDELIAVDSRVSAMDSIFWDTGSTITDSNEPYPLNQFWSARFLVHPDRPNSGPLRFDHSKAKVPIPKPLTHFDSKGAHFTMDGLAGAWLPYGGGNRQCPARNFAKQEIILGFAITLSMLDIELLGSGATEPRQPDMRYYGLGTLPPKGKVRFRVRRRE
ncbi:MAG: hypothetical protein Q9190_000072 [Brigantiaea leucoxantha]